MLIITLEINGEKKFLLEQTFSFIFNVNDNGNGGRKTLLLEYSLIFNFNFIGNEGEESSH